MNIYAYVWQIYGVMFLAMGAFTVFFLKGTKTTIYRYQKNTETGEYEMLPQQGDRAYKSRKVANGFMLIRARKPLPEGSYFSVPGLIPFGLIRQHFYTYTLDGLTFHKAPLRLKDDPAQFGIYPEPSSATAFFANWDRETGNKRAKMMQTIYFATIMMIVIALVGLGIFFKMSLGAFGDHLQTVFQQSVEATSIMQQKGGEMAGAMNVQPSK
jgi:hypothetical protein